MWKTKVIIIDLLCKSIRPSWENKISGCMSVKVISSARLILLQMGMPVACSVFLFGLYQSSSSSIENSLNRIHNISKRNTTAMLLSLLFLFWLTLLQPEHSDKSQLSHMDELTGCNDAWKTTVWGSVLRPVTINCVICGSCQKNK